MAKQPAPKPMPKGKNNNTPTASMSPKKVAGVIKANRATMCEPGGRSGPRETSVEVRRIENGFIVRETSYGGKGGYTSTERFSDKAPTIQIAPTKGGK